MCRLVSLIGVTGRIKLVVIIRALAFGPIVFDFVIVQRHIGRHFAHYFPQAFLTIGAAIESMKTGYFSDPTT